MDPKKRLSLLDTASTISWFAMDACWMNGQLEAAHALAALSLLLMMVTGFIIHRQGDVNAEIGHMAATSWLMMNACWMTSEWLPFFKEVAQVFMILGIVLIVMLGVMNRDALAYFRRFRNK